VSEAPAKAGLEPRPFEVRAGEGNVLRGEAAGEGPAIVQLHGLTATRRYVTHGSRTLQRSGFEAVSYDARAHGESDPAPAGSGYSYDELAEDLLAILDARGDDRVILAGHSMGAHTAAAFALANSDRVAGLVVIGPVSLGDPPAESSIAYWDGLAAGLEAGGVEGFMEAYERDAHDPEWRDKILRLARQRLELHRDPRALAQALRDLARSRPFDSIQALEGLDVPALVVASRDDADPGHPYEVAEAWAEHLSVARLISEGEGESPLAWQGGKLSREIAAFAGEDAVRERLDRRASS
jgi:pimeloyl-ACP methyl ester carboxylesterase